jgi:hypothetical protein
MSILSVNQLLARDINGNVSKPGSAWSTTPCYNIGQEAIDQNGNVYVYVKTASNNAFTIYDAILLLPAGAVSITSTNAADDGAIPVGITPVACVAGGSGVIKYGWVLVKTGAQQVTTIRTAASCADHLGMQTTATAGVLDDATGQPDIVGIGIGTDTGGGGGDNATATLNRPYVQMAFA